jgi:hypothetical protein
MYGYMVGPRATLFFAELAKGQVGDFATVHGFPSRYRRRKNEGSNSGKKTAALGPLLGVCE